MPINPLIMRRIDRLDVPDKIKRVLNDILKTEDNLEAFNDKRNFKASISKILEKYADDEEIMEFCGRHESI